MANRSSPLSLETLVEIVDLLEPSNVAFMHSWKMKVQYHTQVKMLHIETCQKDLLSSTECFYAYFHKSVHGKYHCAIAKSPMSRHIADESRML